MATERIENTSTLPFRFADGATLRDSESGSGDMRGMADPADATPEIYLDPDDPSLGEYGREWQARRAKLGVERSRRMGNPAAANVGRTVMAAWGAEDERRLGTPHLATALSNMVSMEGDAYYAVEDFLADVKSKHKDRREEHYQAAETFEKRGNKEAAAFHRRAAEEWNETSGITEDVYGPALVTDGWEVMTPEDSQGFFALKKTPSGYRLPKGHPSGHGGRFAKPGDLKFTTDDLGEMDSAIRERYGSSSYLVEYKDNRRGVDTSHPFAVVDGVVFGAYDPQGFADAKEISSVYIPPSDWTPPGFDYDHERARDASQRRMDIVDRGTPATPAEVTAEVEDIYHKVDTGTEYTKVQAADIREALQEFREAAAEAYATAERAESLTRLSSRITFGAKKDVKDARETIVDGLLPDAPTEIKDAIVADVDGDGVSDLELVSQDAMPDASEPSGVMPDAQPDAGPMPETASTEPTEPSGERGPDGDILDQIRDEFKDKRIGTAILDPSDLDRHPVIINERAKFKAAKGKELSNEAVEAVQESVQAASRMTRAFARLRKLSTDANILAEGLPDDVDDEAVMYAQMADMEIAQTMPVVQRTNRMVLEAQDMVLYAAEQADNAVELADRNESWLRERYADSGVEYKAPKEALSWAKFEEFSSPDIPAERMGEAVDSLESKVEDRREYVHTPVGQEGGGLTLEAHFSPNSVTVPVDQEPILGEIDGKDVEGYLLEDGNFYSLDDLVPAVNTYNGQQIIENPPEWMEPSDPRYGDKLVFDLKPNSQRLQIENPPVAEVAKPADMTPVDEDALKKMRDYQDSILDGMEEKLKEGNSLLVTAPTGSGKTVVFSEFARRQRLEGKKIVIMAHTEELIRQAADKIEAQTGERPGIVMQDEKDFSKPITIMSHGTVVGDGKNTGPGDIIPDDFKPDIFVIDEAHHAAAQGYKEIIKAVDADKLIGFTATPFRTDREHLVPEPFGDVIRPVTPADLMSRGYLVPAKVEKVRLTAANGMPFSVNYADNLPQLYAEGVSYALSQGRKKVILYVSQGPETIPTEVVNKTKRELERRGISSDAIISQGNTPEERAAAVREFKDKDIAVLVNYRTLVEGFDEPSTDAVIIGRDSQSENDLIQMVGRGLRPFPGKQNVLVLDYTDRDDLSDMLHYWRVDDPESAAQHQAGKGRGGKKQSASQRQGRDMSRILSLYNDMMRSGQVSPAMNINPRSQEASPMEIRETPGRSPEIEDINLRPRQPTNPAGIRMRDDAKLQDSTPGTEDDGLVSGRGGRRRGGKRRGDEDDGGNAKRVNLTFAG